MVEGVPNELGRVRSNRIFIGLSMSAGCFCLVNDCLAQGSDAELSQRTLISQLDDGSTLTEHGTFINRKLSEGEKTIQHGSGNITTEHGTFIDGRLSEGTQT